MGVLYVVFPLDEQMAQYVHEVGAAVSESDQPSRNPTPLEVRDVCGRLTDLRVQMFSPPGHE